MKWKTEWKALAVLAAGFLACYWLPVGAGRFDSAVLASLHLVKWYAREHVVLCLVPAFFIAGAIGVFVSQASVMKYLGAGANKLVAYGVASVSGTILAVCSCTVLPLFAGIYRMGAGLGPAVTFLYSGPAINALAIIMTARILGFELGVARAVGAIVFSIVIGMLMEFLFRGETSDKKKTVLPSSSQGRPLWQNAVYFASMVAILVFANWARTESATGLWAWLFAWKWVLTAGAGVIFALILGAWFGVKWRWLALASLVPIFFAWRMPNEPILAFSAALVALSILLSLYHGELSEWFDQSWGFAKQIMPLLFAGVLVAGFLLGSPGADGGEGVIPTQWVASLVGGNSVQANVFAAVAGAFMYFATLTEVPILQGLIASGMGKGPALALLLAGPAVSLPNMLVIRSVLGTKKTVAYVLLVVVMAAVSGLIFGSLF